MITSRLTVHIHMCRFGLQLIYFKLALVVGTSNCVYNITLRLLLFFEGTCRSEKLNECMCCNCVHGNVKLCGY